MTTKTITHPFFIKNLSEKLLQWTGDRWIISLSKNNDAKSIYEQNLENKKTQILEFKKNKIAQEIESAFKKADHFYVIHYCKKRERIEQRRCYWDDKSKVWETKNGKLAITCVAMDNEEHTIVGYRTFTDIFNVTGRIAKFETSEAIQ